MRHKRTIVVGDIHGCLDELISLLALVKYCPDFDRLIFVGDLVDRGPKSLDVVRYVRELNVECVLGNHEEKYIRFHKHQKNLQATGAKNPMRQFGEDSPKRKLYESLTEGDLAFFSAMPSFVSIDGLDRPVKVIHAGLQPGTSFDKQHPNALLRLRYVNHENKQLGFKIGHRPPEARFWAPLWTGPETIVYGHHVTDLKYPRVDHLGNGVTVYGIDTGCCFGGSLTALLIEHRAFIGYQLIQVPAISTYSHWIKDEDE